MTDTNIVIDTSLDTKSRVVKDVEPPIATLPSDDQVFDDDGKPNCLFLKEHFVREGWLSDAQIKRIIKAATQTLKSEPNLLRVGAPVVISGDIHGQYYDLMRLFEVGGGLPPERQYLFLGDYVDRGYFSIECFVFLLALKICYSSHVWLLRGNHECRHLTKHFTFKLECRYKYDEDVWEECMRAMDALPLAAVVNGQFFCVHGGIGPDLASPDDVLKIDRFQEPGSGGGNAGFLGYGSSKQALLMTDLLWADPALKYDDPDDSTTWARNASRGCSYRFGYSVACEFLKRNGLLSIIRGHEAQDAGYRMYRPVEATGFPSLVTLFSAPNYVDVYNNRGAVLVYDGITFNVRQFSSSPHPYYLPKFMDAFDWSLPFVGQNVTDLLLSILNIPSMQSKLKELTEEQRAKLESVKIAKADALLGTVEQVVNVEQFFATTRTEREACTELINVVQVPLVPNPSELSVGEEELKRAINTFTEAKASDRINEMQPSITEKGETLSLAVTTPPLIATPPAESGGVKKEEEAEVASVGSVINSPVLIDDNLVQLVQEISPTPVIAEQVLPKLVSGSVTPIQALMQVASSAVNQSADSSDRQEKSPNSQQ